MAINLVACTCCGFIQLNAEELVENNPLQELLEKEVKMNNDYILPTFSLQRPFLKIVGTFYFNKNSKGFSNYVQEIHVPPPNSIFLFS